MSNKIIFWETKTEAADSQRTSLWRSVENLGLSITTDIKQLNEVQILFLHGGDKKKLVQSKLDGSGENFVKEVASVWKIIYGGNQTSTSINIDFDEKVIDYINIKQLNSNFKKFLDYIKDKILTEQINEDEIKIWWEILMVSNTQHEAVLNFMCKGDKYLNVKILEQTFSNSELHTELTLADGTIKTVNYLIKDLLEENADNKADFYEKFTNMRDGFWQLIEIRARVSDN